MVGELFSVPSVTGVCVFINPHCKSVSLAVVNCFELFSCAVAVAADTGKGGQNQ